MYDHADRSGTVSRRRAPAARRRARRRRRAAMPLIFCAMLFCSGFLLGKVSAAWAAPMDTGTRDVSLFLSTSQNGKLPFGGDAPVRPSAGDVPSEAPDGGTSGTGAIQSQGGEPPGTGAPGSGSSEEAWKLMLVNRENPLPSDFSEPELTQLKNGHRIDSRAYPALQEMMDAARAAGYQPLICSSYRSKEKQTQLFENKTQTYLARGYSQAEAEEQASFWVARPGTSEHQTGLAVDIVDQEYQMLDRDQEDRPVQQWLMEHCAEYGFILRYPTEKSSLTGVGYEPWHYRYVGVDAARYIMEQGLCLEEYLAQQ